MKLQSGQRILHPCIWFFFFTFQLLCVGYIDFLALDTSKCVDYILRSYHLMILANFLTVHQCDLYTYEFYPPVNGITCGLYHQIFSTAHLYNFYIIHSFIWLVAGFGWDLSF